MKRKLSSLFLMAAVFTVLTGTAIGAIHNEKYSQMCFDRDGNRVDTSKECEGGCGCLFHRVEEYIKELFK